ncbi:hypothetical protein M408DRAFT_72773 [Serendipita vermifera MAFF 305830]|uniref:AAA+ ATPase domain-containing protein n=1 Tax=Serendipita vermifera MAFF 305830 TaxID=933852 RepID=A0A0C3APB4_SERVB|nr:hypothetical protein M408DRAFT_72773 [Serendipita vermifera MAFF 305830]
MSLVIERPDSNAIQTAHSLDLLETTAVSSKRLSPQFSTSDSPKQDEDSGLNWLILMIREILVETRYICIGREVQLQWEGTQRTFRIVDARTKAKSSKTPSRDTLENMMNGLALSKASSHEGGIWVVGWNCDIQLVAGKPQPGERDAAVQPIEGSSPPPPYESVGGLSKQISQIRDLIEIPLTRPALFSHFNLKPPRGLLLHGPPGTGKTHLARAIAASARATVIVVNGPELSSAYHGESEKKLREVFERARKESPCIVVLDEVDAMCPKRDDGGEGGEVAKRVVATLLTLMDGMDEAENATPDGVAGRVVVVATTNRPNAIDPALRRPGRFDRELEIGIPDASARLEILNVMLRTTPHSLSSEELRTIASQTHGYVGADLAGLVREAGTLAIKRVISSDATPALPQLLTYADFLQALPHTRPSALRSLILETPHVSWSDIGGVSHVRERLREAIEWPLLHAETFSRLGVTPTKGVLLYGPPGCSKTLTAKALATESGINFLAVKGPELLNKFVGESERAVREVFAKARAGAPCIVFFDEIDALGTARSEDGRTGAHEGVLTSMLNEMDGIQDLHGVIVVAATNRPDVMDSALMRPGRLDRILYVGPPDAPGREEILRIRTRKMALGHGVDFARLASMTDGCSGAELAAMCQEAAMMAMRENIHAAHVSLEHFVAAAARARRGITPDVVEKFRKWRERSGLSEV